MKSYLGYILLFLIIVDYCITLRFTGIKLKAGEELIHKILDILTPIIQDKLRKIIIPDQNLKIRLVNVSLSDISIALNNFTSDAIKLEVETKTRPLLVNLQINGIQASGGFKGKAKWSVLSSSFKVDLNFKNIDLDSQIAITETYQDGRKVLTGYFKKLDLKMDWSLKFKGNLPNDITNLIKQPIRNSIEKGINNFFSKKAREILTQTLEKIPIGFRVLINGEKFEINNDSKKLQFKFPTEGSKDFHLYISYDKMKEMFIELFNSKPMEFSISNKYFDVDFLSKAFPGFKDIYIKSNKAALNIKAKSKPEISFRKSKIVLKIPSFLELYLIEEGGSEPHKAGEFLTTIFLNIGIYYTDNGSLTFLSDKLTFDGMYPANSVVNLKLELDFVKAEQNLNMISELINPFFNSYLKDGILISLINHEGIKIQQSSIKFYEDFIEIGYNIKSQSLFTIETSKIDKDHFSIQNSSPNCPNGNMLIKAELVKSKDKYYYNVLCSKKDFYEKEEELLGCQNSQKLLKDLDDYLDLFD